MSIHRACCCGCPEELTVDIVGVDAAKCACTSIGGNSYLMSLLSVDGTYVLPFVTESTVGGRPICIYQICYDTGATIATRENYTGTTVCAGAPATTDNYPNLVIGVILYKENKKIRFLSIGLPLDPSNCASGPRVFIKPSVAYPGLDLNTAIANTLSCGSNDVASGGTFEVHL